MILLRVKSLCIKIISVLNNLISKKHKVYYVVETANWSIKEDGKNLKKSIAESKYIKLTHSGLGIRNSIIHYGTEGVFFNKNEVRTPHKSNKVIVTWFHIIENDSKITNLLNADKSIDLWHTSCVLTKKKLIALGIDCNKIRVIPLGINLNIYKPIKKEIIEKRKDELNIPKNTIVIGSFQKDGIGWGKGTEPKLEKGPDIFCSVVEELSKKYNLYILLTGPARGYVKERLNRSNIKYFHKFLDNPDDVAHYFQLCDMYIISSREEGGPKAVLESMACGVPLISTKVGMAPDIINHGKDGFLCDVEDKDSLFKYCELLINDEQIKNKIIKNAKVKVANYSQHKITELYKNMYKELI